MASRSCVSELIMTSGSCVTELINFMYELTNNEAVAFSACSHEYAHVPSHKQVALRQAALRVGVKEPAVHLKRSVEHNGALVRARVCEDLEPGLAVREDWRFLRHVRNAPLVVQGCAKHPRRLAGVHVAQSLCGVIGIPTAQRSLALQLVLQQADFAHPLPSRQCVGRSGWHRAAAAVKRRRWSLLKEEPVALDRPVGVDALKRKSIPTHVPVT
eukprot:7379140-Prymnesium_polylepis.1